MSKKGCRDVSSPNLYHFTPLLKNLISILSSKQLKVSKCKERYPFIQKDLIRDVPAVCFCDLPKGARADHKEKYGYYAISFNKKWADKYKICPVIYCRQHGKLSKYIQTLYNNPNLPTQIKDGVLDFCKPTKGFEYIKEEHCWSKTQVKFLDEREWRYVPDNIESTRFLNFSLSDILYVYVENEVEKQQLRGLIAESKIKVSSKK